MFYRRTGLLLGLLLFFTAGPLEGLAFLPTLLLLLLAPAGLLFLIGLLLTDLFLAAAAPFLGKGDFDLDLDLEEYEYDLLDLELETDRAVLRLRGGDLEREYDLDEREYDLERERERDERDKERERDRPLSPVLRVGRDRMGDLDLDLDLAPGEGRLTSGDPRRGRASARRGPLSIPRALLYPFRGLLLFWYPPRPPWL